MKLTGSDNVTVYLRALMFNNSLSADKTVKFWKPQTDGNNKHILHRSLATFNQRQTVDSHPHLIGIHQVPQRTSLQLGKLQPDCIQISPLKVKWI